MVEDGMIQLNWILISLAEIIDAVSRIHNPASLSAENASYVT